MDWIDLVGHRGQQYFIETTLSAVNKGDEMIFYLLYNGLNASKSRQMPVGNSLHIDKGFNDELRSS